MKKLTENFSLFLSILKVRLFLCSGKKALGEGEERILRGSDGGQKFLFIVIGY